MTLFLSDYLRLRSLRGVSFSSGLGYLLVTGSLAAFLVIMIKGAGFQGPITVLGALLSLSFGSLLLYSVFLEIPEAKKRLGLGPDEALTGGTYGFSRHPGFLWFLGLMGGLILLGGGRGLAFAVYISSLNFLLILAQDRYFFPRFFKNYRDYQSQVPFLFGFRRRRADEHV